MIRECIHHKSFKTKLALYGMTTNQINSLAAAKRTNPVITIYSPIQQEQRVFKSESY
jgi:hypothetical protein